MSKEFGLRGLESVENLPKPGHNLVIFATEIVEERQGRTTRFEHQLYADQKRALEQLKRINSQVKRDLGSMYEAKSPDLSRKAA